jgi:hypothetical protein
MSFGGNLAGPTPRSAPGAQTTDKAHDDLKRMLAGVRFDAALGPKRLIDERLGRASRRRGGGTALMVMVTFLRVAKRRRAMVLPPGDFPPPTRRRVNAYPL